MDGPKRMLWTLGLVFAVGALTKWLEIGGAVGIDSEAWAGVFDAGLAALAAFIINFASPWIKQYGYTGSGE